MLRNLGINGVVIGAAVLGAGFATVVTLADPVSLIIVLNGIFIGMMVAISIAYGRLIVGSIFAREEYNRVRQMALGIAVGWAAIAVGVLNSFYLRTLAFDIPTTPLTAAARFLAIVAAIMQITAPDFGQGVFYGRDRRALWIAGTLGAVVSVVAVYVQWNGLRF